MASLRRGISILEVLFAMGVVAIGLLGVMAIVPVGLHLVGKGQVSDRSSRAGQNALREFQTRGMARADQWLYFHPHPAVGWTRVTWNPGLDNSWGAPGDDDNDGLPNTDAEAGWPNSDDVLTDYPIPGAAFAIDPRFLASRTLPPEVATPRLNFERLGPTQPNGNEFPYRQQPQLTRGFERPLLKMRRVSLKRFPLISSNDPRGRLPLGKAHADQLFMLNDDLVFELPQENEPPEQQYTWMVGPDGAWGVDTVDDDRINGTDDPGEAGWPGSDDVPVMREFEGEYSWMATMVPKRDQVGLTSDQYILSIVVFHNRDPLMEMNQTNERVAYIRQADFHSDGFSGGDVTLHAYTRSPNPTNDLQARAGDWVLLSTLLAHPVRGPSPYFRWYRVAQAGDVEDLSVTNMVNISREVTLEGPDWPLAAIIPHPNPTFENERDHTRVTLVSNVVAVYERSITIEN